MRQRLTILGTLMVISGIVGFAVGGYTAFRTMNGANSLAAFSRAQAVSLAYDESGRLTDHGSAETAQKILDLVERDWGYALDRSELDPADPIVNTASEYMYQLGTITEHTLTAKVTVTLPADAKRADGTVVPAGDHEFQNTGKYYSQFDRTDPVEGAARSMVWSPLALSLIAQLGVGAVTANSLQIGFGLVGVIWGLAGTLFVLGLGILWAIRGRDEEETPAAA